MLTFLQRFWPETAVKGFETATFGSVFFPKLEGGNIRRHPRISGPTYCLTFYSSVGRVLVYQPSRPRLNSWHVSFRVSYYKWKPNHTAATHHVFVYCMEVFNIFFVLSKHPKYSVIFYHRCLNLAFTI